MEEIGLILGGSHYENFLLKKQEIKSHLLEQLIILSKVIYAAGADMEEIYEIDYRGPETHSYIPPPNWGICKPPFLVLRHKNGIKYVAILTRISQNPQVMGSRYGTTKEIWRYIWPT